MRKRNLAIAAAFIAGSLGSAQATQPVLTQDTRTATEIKSTPAQQTKKKVSHVKIVGGLDLVHESYHSYGMSPMEYGMKYGHGNKKKHTNTLRISHNHKVAKRKK